MPSFSTGVDGSGIAQLGTYNGIPSTLMEILVNAGDIEPGSPPSYELCKQIYTYHTLGAKMAEAPIELAQSQEREIEIPGAPQQELVDEFQRVWRSLGQVGATQLVKNVKTLSRVYGIAALGLVAKDLPPDKPLPLNELWKHEITFNTFDPLNTAGSLVLNQDPNAPDFMQPVAVTVGSQRYHPSRSVIVMNEQPVYIQWTNSAFGFVGRSVYQRALYPLKSFIQTQITDDWISWKAGLLVAKMKAPGSIIDQRARTWFGFKRSAIQSGGTNNVLSIGLDEDVASIDLKNLKDAAEYSRTNILKNIATAAKMPARMLDQETLAEGFGEGSEDAKQIARYIDGLRLEMAPIYRWLDAICMHIAWSPTFYESLQSKYSELRDVEYETAFYRWRNAFNATWPNLLVEPDSEKSKVAETRFKSAVALAEVILPTMDQANKARVVEWLQNTANGNDFLFDTTLELDIEALAAYEPPAPEKEPGVEPFSYRS